MRRGPAPAYQIWKMDRHPARPIDVSEDGPGRNLAHQTFRLWAAARPLPSHFQIVTARPGPAQ